MTDIREQKRSKEFDAYYYVDTGEWVEEKCSDSSCEFCANRPPKYNPKEFKA